MEKEKMNKSEKKELRQEVLYKLEHTFGKLKERLGEKKFHSRIKKAAKILTEDMGPVKTEKVEKKKTAPVKAGKKAAPVQPEKAVIAEAITEPAKPAPKKTAPVAAEKKAEPKKAVKKPA